MNKQKLLHREQNNIGEADDRISELPDSLLHHILSFTDTIFAAQTLVLSKRWNRIWTSIPNLDFEFYEPSEEMNKFMDFVHRTLHLHDISSNIQKFSLHCNDSMNASRVRSWIENLTSRDVKELDLLLDACEPSCIPLSLFTCESLTKLELSVSHDFDFPKSVSFPKLRSLALWDIQFAEGYWNEQLFSNCPVLEELKFGHCFFDVVEFSILAPALKVLEFENDDLDQDGLQDCDLKIHAPSLVSFTYQGSVAKDYDLSSFLKLDKAEVHLFKFESRREQRIGRAAAASKFLQSLSHVRCLSVRGRTVKVLSAAKNFMNNLPTFHNLNELHLLHKPATDTLIFAFLKAAPNLKRLLLDKYLLSSINDKEKRVPSPTEDLFRHLQSVEFLSYSGGARGLRWVELILKNANSLQTMTISCKTSVSNRKSTEAVKSEILSLPRASGRCVVKFVKNLW